MGHVTKSASPYPGLELAQALLVALPLLWLPTAVARLFKRARAGIALLLVPPIVWLLNHGTVLLGTEYGLADSVSTLRVYALYGIAASLAFLSLSLIVLLSTYRLRTRVLIAATLLIGVIAGVGNLTRSLSGMGVALAVGVLWWIHVNGRWRWAAAAAASILTIVVALAVQSGVMGLVNAARVEATGQSVEQVPDGHTVWHSLYLGLSYPQPLTGVESRFDVTWSDEFGWEKAREVDPDVLVASEEYDAILQDLYLEEVFADPIGALKLYVLKGIFLIKHFGAMTALIVAGFALTFIRHPHLRRPLGIVVAISLPTLVLGVVPPVLVMPMLYYYSELSAALGLLAAVALGALTWSLTTLPCEVRAKERRRLRDRPLPATLSAVSPSGLSVIIASHGEKTAIEASGTRWAHRLTADDAIIVVPTGATDTAPGVLEELAAGWSGDCRFVVLPSQPGLGEALRTGVLASTGRKLVVAAGAPDDIPDLAQVDQPDVVVAIGSAQDAETSAAQEWRSASHTRFTQFLREALLRSHGASGHTTFVVDGTWGRRFASVSRENGPLWLDELVLVAEQQGLQLARTPAPEGVHTSPTSLFLSRGTLQTCAGILRLALHRDEHRGEAWSSEQAS
ncbi:glycosyltransferase [Homoserinimonas sp. A447]